MDTNPQVTEWAFDTVAGRISAVDGQGREVMALSADPLFGPRLAAAFGWPVMATGSWQQQMQQRPQMAQMAQMPLTPQMHPHYPPMRSMSMPPRPAPMLQPVVKLAAMAAVAEVALQA